MPGKLIKDLKTRERGGGCLKDEHATFLNILICYNGCTSLVSSTASNRRKQVDCVKPGTC